VAQRDDARRNRERILAVAERMLRHSEAVSVADVAAAAGVSRATVHRHFGSRRELAAAVADRTRADPATEGERLLPAGHLGRERPLVLDAIHVFDVVPPAALPEQLTAEAERLAGVPVALYVLDIDGTHLLRIAGTRQLPAQIEAPLAIGPELDADGISSLRRQFGGRRGIEIFPLWLRGRATGLFITTGRPHQPLTELARQAAAAVTLADRYTDAFAAAQRRKGPKAAAEIQQSLLPPRISRVTGGEVAGSVLPSYEVGGDWFDIVENADGVWIALADGLGGSTPAAASSAIALGALRASRRGGAGIEEGLMTMHGALREMPGPRPEMTALIVHWTPGTQALRVASCGHVAPVILKEDGQVERLDFARSRGLGGRAAPKPSPLTTHLRSGDRLVAVSDGVVGSGDGKAGLGLDGVVEAALRSERLSAADTVREVHRAVMRASGGELSDDATAVCLAAG